MSRLVVEYTTNDGEGYYSNIVRCVAAPSVKDFIKVFSETMQGIVDQFNSTSIAREERQSEMRVIIAQMSKMRFHKPRTQTKINKAEEAMSQLSERLKSLSQNQFSAAHTINVFDTTFETEPFIRYSTDYKKIEDYSVPDVTELEEWFEQNKGV